MKHKIEETLERLYKNIKEYGYAHPVQTRPAPEPGFTKEDPMKGDEAAEDKEDEVKDERKERKDDIEKSPGDISRMRPHKY